MSSLEFQLSSMELNSEDIDTLQAEQNKWKEHAQNEHLMMEVEAALTAANDARSQCRATEYEFWTCRIALGLGGPKLILKDPDRALFKKKEVLDRCKVDHVRWVWKPMRLVSKPFIDRGLVSTQRKSEKKVKEDGKGQKPAAVGEELAVVQS